MKTTIGLFNEEKQTMKTFFQLREELLKEDDDHKDTYDYHKSESEDGGPSEKVSKNHYRGEGDRGGIPFSYKHGNKHGSSEHDPEDSLSKIHKDIKSNNSHLADSEIKHSAKIIHKHMSEMDY